MKSMQKQKGFTLIELLIVIAIIGMLATLAVVSLTSAQQRARDTKRVADIKALQTAMELNWNENAQYPALVAGTDTWATLSAGLTDFISALPVDPDHADGSTYTYLVNMTATDTQQQYYVAATLENPTHNALEQDIDGAVGAAGWVGVNSVGGTATALGAGGSLDCDDAVYCLLGDATVQ